MKKIIALLCAVSLITAAFAGCGNPGDSNSSGQESYANNPNGIPSELEDFKLYIDGEEFSLPMSFDDLEAKGWKYQGSKDIYIPAHKYLNSDAFKKGESVIGTRLTNKSDVDIKIPDGEIAALTIRSEDITNQKVELTKEISLGKSTPNDVKSAYGEPTYEEDSDDIYVIDYESAYNVKYRFIFKGEDKTLKEIELTNMPEFSQPD